MEYTQITVCNSFILDAFLFSLSKEPSKHFRYYNTRDHDEYKRHIYTVIITVDMTPVAYGHIELEEKYWIGICVLEEFRGKGYGKKMLTHLIDIARSKRIPRLSLTVDKDNDVALALYRSYNFTLTYEYKEYFLMSLNLLPSSEVVTLPVSYGDAFDKLAILEIKMSKVSAEKKEDVKREYDAVLCSISHLFNETVSFYYKHLIDCSVVIWDKQVTFRSATVGRTELCEEIIFENDRRGKLKNKVNKILSSYLVEQKDGYILKKAFVSPSNLFTSIGQIRYLATVYDEVLVYNTNDQFSLIFSDDNTIKCTSINVSPEEYIVVDLEEGSRKEYFYVPTTENSKEMYQKVRGREYILTNINIEINSIHDIIIIDVNKSHNEFGDYFINKNTIDYKDLLINANTLYLKDDLLHFALNLDLKCDHSPVDINRM